MVLVMWLSLMDAPAALELEYENLFLGSKVYLYRVGTNVVGTTLPHPIHTYSQSR